jgi:hypothetical protein
MTFLTGLVGHHGRIGYRLYCGLEGRHKPSAPIYYVVLCQPANNNHHNNQYKMEQIIHCQSMAKYKLACLKTDISKPSIFCGFDSDHILLVPLCFNLDIIHVVAINTGNLLIPLWRGTLRTEFTDNWSTWAWAVLTKVTWRAHRSLVADAPSYQSHLIVHLATCRED